jgi:hypothetical protein
MSLELNTRTWYESSKKDPIPRAGWYEDFYNTQYQNQGGEFKVGYQMVVTWCLQP